MSGAMDLVIGAGVESMSRVAMGSDGGSISDEIGKRFDIIPQGLSAELLCDRWQVSRESLDQLAYNSHQRALKATSEGYFSREILPIDVTIDGATTSFTTDEGQISDGASAILVGSGEKADELGLTRRARFRSMAVSGVDPTMMLSGVIPATEKALKKAGMTMADVDLFEVNEAFGSVVLAWAKDTGADLDKTNVNGGAMALGHPLGCSGARLMTTLLHELERQDKSVGLATLCIGFGMAVATVIERT